MDRIVVVDSHTGGEPTRLVVKGLPEIKGTVHDRIRTLENEFDWIRKTLCTEPRGFDIAIGAVIFPPSESGCNFDMIFFNNSGYLEMCGHGTIGVVATLNWMARKGEEIPVGPLPDELKLNTVAGVVQARIVGSHQVEFENVASIRYRKDVAVSVPGYGNVLGDIAYGGNWFFLVKDSNLHISLSNLKELMDFSCAVMDALAAQSIRGADEALIDHVEVFGTPESAEADSKNFVLCPGHQYDRSPCGTGTSAKLACLFADEKLVPGAIWRQESITGSVFEGTIDVRDGLVFPTIRGSAFVTAHTEIVYDPADPTSHFP